MVESSGVHPSLALITITTTSAPFATALDLSIPATISPTFLYLHIHILGDSLEVQNILNQLHCHWHNVHLSLSTVSVFFVLVHATYIMT
jgi:hypothetical protein